MDESPTLATKLQSTKLIMAAGIFCTATALLIGDHIPSEVWADVTQTVLLGYVAADVAQKFVKK